MMRWRMLMLGLALGCSLTTGCRQQLFLAEEDFNKAMTGALPANFEHHPLDAIAPPSGVSPTPADVNRPDRPPRYMTLQEAIAIALENGNTSSRQPGFGKVDDTLAAGVVDRLQNQSENIRVLSLFPAISQAAIENQLARYDAQWVTSMNWTTTDALQQGLQSFNNGSAAAFATSFLKAMPWGGTANISFLTDYRLLTNPPTGLFGVLNPQYTSRLVFGIDAPLWRDYGTEINQLLARHPAAGAFSPVPGQHAGAFASHQNNLVPFGAAPEGILIARVRHEQQKAEFERHLNAMILNVEAAYWQLYQAYGQLYSFEEVFRISHRAWMINKAKYDVGTKGPVDYFPVEGQYHEFRGERLGSLANVIEAERNLRGLMNLPVEDGTRIVPVTPPTLAAFQPNYDAAVRDAMIYRPELALARENLRVSHYQLIVQKNNLKPELRGSAQYSPVGFGNRLDGAGTFIDGTGTPRTQNAFRSLATDHFNDWSIGLILNVPLGYRAEMANVRAARLSLAQAYYFLKDQEEKTQRVVAQNFQDLSRWYNQIEARRDERRAYAQLVEARFKEFLAGKVTPAEFLLDAQRRLASAQVKEYEAIAQYNITLAKLEWSKGTLMHHNNVFISEGPLPEFMEKRAVEHEHERTKAHVLRYRPEPVTHPGQCAQVVGELHGEPTTINLPIPDDVKIPAEALQMPRRAAPGVPAQTTGGGDKLSAPAATQPSDPGKAKNAGDEPRINYDPASHLRPGQTGPVPGALPWRSGSPSQVAEPMPSAYDPASQLRPGQTVPIPGAIPWRATSPGQLPEPITFTAPAGTR
jgi:outer membrane protein TolC